MAYAKTPSLDTYGSDRLQLYHEVSPRDGGVGKDVDYLNVFIEPLKNQSIGSGSRMLVNRSGTEVVINSVASSEVRGMFFWPDKNKLFYAVGTNVYVYNTITGVSNTISSPFGTSSGPVGFCEYLYDNGNVVIIATDGTTLLSIDDSNTVVTCVDADLPSPHQPYPVFLNGYLFLAKANSADLYNSVLNNPMSWETSSFISTEMEADLIVRIAKLNNYIVVFGKETIEYFWDAAVEPPGSPLQRNDTPIKINTYLSGFAIYGNSIYYIGVNAGGMPDVFVLKDFKIEEMGTPGISRYLRAARSVLSSWSGNIVSCNGHTFYVLSTGTTKTYACDIENKLWCRWAWRAENIFNIKYALSLTNANTAGTFFCLAGASSTIYQFNDEVYQDAGTNFSKQWYTNNADFDTMNRKSMHKLTIIGDRPASNSNLLVQWSDDDYKTFNSGLTVNLNQDIPCVYRLGSFRRRAFKFTHTDNAPLRVQDVEVDINKGMS